MFIVALMRKQGCNSGLSQLVTSITIKHFLILLIMLLLYDIFVWRFEI